MLVQSVFRKRKRGLCIIRRFAVLSCVLAFSLLTACGGGSGKPAPPEITSLTWTMTNAIQGDPENQSIPRDVYIAPGRLTANEDAKIVNLTCTGGEKDEVVFTNTDSGEQWIAGCGDPELSLGSRVYPLTFADGQAATAICAVTTYYDADRNESYEYTLIVSFPPESGIPEFHFAAPVEC
ncbi:MAG: hypothetical protein ACLU8W_12220 [Clostridia bacterium]